jgi:ABC-type microcin C transport system duplicated ATPase subunit YejF
MKTINKIQTATAGFVVERGDAREILANPQEARAQAFLEKGL